MAPGMLAAIQDVLGEFATSRMNESAGDALSREIVGPLVGGVGAPPLPGAGAPQIAPGADPRNPAGLNLGNRPGG